MMARFPLRPGWLGTALIAALAVGAVACAAPSTRYVQDGSTNTFFGVPADWTVVDRTPGQASAGGANPYQTTGDPVVYSSAFAPEAALASESNGPLSFDVDQPVGFTTVFALTPDEQDQVSMKTLRNQIFDIDSLYSQDPNAIIMFQSDPLSDQGYRGEHLVYSVRASPDPSIPYSDSVTINQTSYLDPTGSLAYQFLIGCRSTCYQDNASTIEGVVRSWSVTPS
jgi:hypothetical protein